MILCWWVSVFFQGIFVTQPRWQSSLGICRESGDNPYEDLAKFGYIPDLKHKLLYFLLLYFWLLTGTKYSNLAKFSYFLFFFLLVMKTAKNNLIFQIQYTYNWHIQHYANLNVNVMYATLNTTCCTL